MTTSAEWARAVECWLMQPDMGRQEFEQQCAQARAKGYYGVGVPGSRVALACHCLEESSVKVIAAAGFPWGLADSDVKRYEVEAAVDSGAQEIMVPLNHTWLKDGQDKAVLRELRDLVEAAQEHAVKAIVEPAWLNAEELKRACGLVRESGVEFVQITSGFGAASATAEQVQQIRGFVGAEFGVLAAGSYRDAAVAGALLAAGADRLGTPFATELLATFVPQPEA